MSTTATTSSGANNAANQTTQANAVASQAKQLMIVLQNGSYKSVQSRLGLDHLAARHLYGRVHALCGRISPPRDAGHGEKVAIYRTVGDCRPDC
uniref:Uncharacterized protein n=1 Tax=Caenorhabditis japonica TaxID=281687 RepID=A0A8R1EG30_CAEJA